MIRILVIADDFTGAAEIGGIAKEFGLNAWIAFGQVSSASSEVLVIDTDTRHMSAADAGGRLRSILDQVNLKEFDFVFKKTDSVLRGPIAAELEAIGGVLGFARSLLIAQNPSRGRTIENGMYFIDGVELSNTSFANDPDYPAKSADVRELVRANVHRRSVNESPGETGITIGNGKCAEDLNYWASQLTDETLAAGGADFFTAILRARGLVRSGRPTVPVDTNGAVFICGSAISRFSRGCMMPRILFDGDALDEAALETWREMICGELRTKGRAIVGVGHALEPQRAVHVRQVLGEITARVLRACTSGTLFVEGGATAAAVIQRLGWLDLLVVGELSGGVVVLQPLDKPDQILVVKPGSYAWPAGLLKALRYPA
jgi:uncharacterized protein YgbK (DUF1537 family)